MALILVGANKSILWLGWITCDCLLVWTDYISNLSWFLSNFCILYLLCTWFWINNQRWKSHIDSNSTFGLFSLIKLIRLNFFILIFLVMFNVGLLDLRLKPKHPFTTALKIFPQNVSPNMVVFVVEDSEANSNQMYYGCSYGKIHQNGLAIDDRSVICDYWINHNWEHCKIF